MKFEGFSSAVVSVFDSVIVLRGAIFQKGFETRDYALFPEDF